MLICLQFKSDDHSKENGNHGYDIHVLAKSQLFTIAIIIELNCMHKRKSIYIENIRAHYIAIILVFP
jgi:hypothetical protein